jgi:hypothetical protein
VEEIEILTPLSATFGEGREANIESATRAREPPVAPEVSRSGDGPFSELIQGIDMGGNEA